MYNPVTACLLVYFESNDKSKDSTLVYNFLSFWVISFVNAIIVLRNLGEILTVGSKEENVFLFELLHFTDA